MAARNRVASDPLADRTLCDTRRCFAVHRCLPHSPVPQRRQGCRWRTGAVPQIRTGLDKTIAGRAPRVRPARGVGLFMVGTQMPGPAAKFTVEERTTRGRAARAKVPRSSHGAFVPAPRRPDPVALLEKQAATRVPELV